MGPATDAGDSYLGGGMGSGARWEPSRRSVTFDVVLAAGFGVGAAASLYMGGDPFITGEAADYSRPVGIGLMAALVVCVAARRQFPLVVLAVATVAFVPLRVTEVPEYVISGVAYFVVLYSAGAYGGRQRQVVRAVAAVAIGGLVTWSIAYQSDGYDGRVPLELVNAFGAAQNVFYLAGAWMLGDLVHNRRRREAVLEGQAAALRQAQADNARQAVLDERLRIARELHDVVAHHVSLMGVQAGAARRMLDRRPETVPELLSSVEESSRQAIGEMQTLLRLLRRDDTGDADAAAGDGAGAGGTGGPPTVPAPASAAPGDGDVAAASGSDRAPQPTLARLDVLVDQMREAGLRVELRADGADRWLPLGVDLAAYRIVQEALTNTLKHAGVAAAVEVEVARRPDALDVSIVDDGAASGRAPATIGSPPGPGHGLVGMRERVRLLGGELRAQRRSGGGFEVRAWLPLGSAKVRG